MMSWPDGHRSGEKGGGALILSWFTHLETTASLPPCKGSLDHSESTLTRGNRFKTANEVRNGLRAASGLSKHPPCFLYQKREIERNLCYSPLFVKESVKNKYISHQLLLLYCPSARLKGGRCSVKRGTRTSLN